MSRNEAYINSLIENSGLLKLRARGLSNVWTVADGESVPIYIPKLINRYSEVQIQGAFGIYVKPFEEWWRSILTENGYSFDVGHTLAIGLYMTNISGFQNLPSFDLKNSEKVERDAIMNWIEKIKFFLSKCPIGLLELNSCFNNGSINNIPIRKFAGHDVKWRMLAKWAAQNELNQIYEVAINMPIVSLSPYERLESYIQL